MIRTLSCFICQPALFIFYSIILLFPRIAAGQTGPDTSAFRSDAVFTSAALKEDILYLKNAYLEAHPSLYSYISERSLEELFDKALASVDRDMNYAEFIRIVNPLVTSIRCAHTLIWAPHAFNTYSRIHHRIFPFAVKYIDSKLYISKNYSSAHAIKDWTEIISINGVSAERIVREKILPAYCNDGYNITSGMRWMDDDGFAEMYALYIGTPDIFNMELRSPDKKKINIRVPAELRDSIEFMRGQRYAESSKTLQPLSLKFMQENKIAVLTLSSFWKQGIQTAGQNFDRFIDSAFNCILEQETESLVIDLRNNRGGSTQYGSRLLSYLSDSSFYYVDSIEMVISGPPAFAKGFNLGDSSDYNILPDGRYLLKTNPATQLIPAAKNPFKGSVYILMNGGTFSAAGIFVAVAHGMGKAVFIGEESGSNYNSLNGHPVWATLPNTGTRCSVPVQKHIYNSSTKPKKAGRGVMPDHTVLPDINDLKSGVDTEMEFVLKLIMNYK